MSENSRHSDEAFPGFPFDAHREDTMKTSCRSGSGFADHCNLEELGKGLGALPRYERLEERES
jgi:hypothetical protein